MRKLSQAIPRPFLYGYDIPNWTPDSRRILGSDGTFEHHFEEPLQYWPEKTNRSDGESTRGKTHDQNHMANWIDCIRSRRTPNAPPEIGYRSALAVHMANLSYKNKRRITACEI